MYDEEGQPTTSLSFPLYQFSSYCITANNTVRHWDIDPPLPPDIYINHFSMTIEGRPKQYYELADSYEFSFIVYFYSYTLSAYNDGGSTNLTITLSLLSCQYGFYVQYISTRTYPGTVHLTSLYFFSSSLEWFRDTSQVIYDFTHINNTYICIPLTAYKITFIPEEQSSEPIGVQLRREDGLVSFHQSFSTKEQQTFTINLCIVLFFLFIEVGPQPSLSLVEQQHIVNIRTNEEFHYSFHFSDSSASFYPPVFFPPLPPTVTFNVYTTSIEGVFDHPGDVSYLVTFSNTLAITTTILFIHIRGI